MSVATFQADECRQFVPEQYHDGLERWFEPGTALQVEIHGIVLYGVPENVDAGGVSVRTNPGATAYIEWNREPQINVLDMIEVVGQLNNALLKFERLSTFGQKQKTS